jgi:hypothetical protein
MTVGAPNDAFCDLAKQHFDAAFITNHPADVAVLVSFHVIELEYQDVALATVNTRVSL